MRLVIPDYKVDVGQLREDYENIVEGTGFNGLLYPDADGLGIPQLLEAAAGRQYASRCNLWDVAYAASSEASRNNPENIAGRIALYNARAPEDCDPTLFGLMQPYDEQLKLIENLKGVIERRHPSFTVGQLGVRGILMLAIMDMLEHGDKVGSVPGLVTPDSPFSFLERGFMRAEAQFTGRTVHGSRVGYVHNSDGAKLGVTHTGESKHIGVGVSMGSRPSLIK